MTLARFVGLEDQSGAIPMLREVTVETIDGEVDLAVGVPVDVEVVLVERPVAGLGRELVPRQPPRLVEPETVRIGVGEVVQR